MDGVERRAVRNADVLVREEELAVTDRDDEHGGRAVEDVAGGDEIAIRLEEVGFGGCFIVGRFSKLAEDCSDGVWREGRRRRSEAPSVHRDVRVDGGRAVERIEDDGTLARRSVDVMRMDSSSSPAIVGAETDLGETNGSSLS